MRAAALALLCWPALAAGQDVVVIGEIHDNPRHHLNQARIVAEVNPSALIFEMLTSAQVEGAAGVDRTDETALGAALGWDGTGWPHFSDYWPIFEAGPDAVLYGAAVPPPDLHVAMDDGALAAFGEGALDYGLGPLPPEAQASMEARLADAHCGALPEDLIPRLVEAQRLRDAAFARTVLEALDETGGPVVLIAGTGHASTEDGVPAILVRVRPGVSVRAIGQVEGEVPADAPFDEVISTEAPDREDPCRAFEAD